MTTDADKTVTETAGTEKCANIGTDAATGPSPTGDETPDRTGGSPSGDGRPPASRHPRADRLAAPGSYALARCDETDSGCGSLFLCPSEGPMRLGDDARCPWCGSRLVMAGKSETPSGTDMPAQVIPFEIDRGKAQERFSEWLSRQSYLPVAMKDSAWDWEPVYAAQSWHSWDCRARIAGIARRSEDSRHGTTSRDVWVPRYAIGTGTIPLLGAPDASGLDDKRMGVLRPYGVKGKAVPSWGDAESVTPSDAVIELPRKAPADCVEASHSRAREMFLDGLRQEASMATICAKETRISERSDSPGALSVPVWSIRQKDGDASFLMNGQTGEIAGEVPMDADARRRFLMRTGGACAVASVALAVATWLGMGGPSYVPGPFATDPDPTVMAWVVLTLVALFSAATIWFADSRRMEGRKEAEGTDPTSATDWPGKGIRNLHVLDRKKIGPAESSLEMATAHAIAGFAEEKGI